MLFGSVVMVAACAMMLVSELGCDPAGVLYNGIYLVCRPLSYGTSTTIFSVLVTAAMFLFFPQTMYFGTVVMTVLFGPLTDLCLYAVALIWPLGIPELWRWILCAGGALLIPVALAIYLPIDWGVSCVDALVLGFQKVFRSSYKMAFWGMYAVFTALGLLLGAPVGAGTLMAIILTGPIIAFLSPRFKRWFYRALKLEDDRQEPLPAEPPAPAEAADAANA